MKHTNILFITQNQRGNDFAITPYLFSVISISKEDEFKVFGLGVCWGFYAFAICIGFGLTNHYKFLKHIHLKKKGDLNKS